MRIQETVARLLARNRKEHQETAEQAMRFDQSLLSSDLEGLIIKAKATLDVMADDLQDHFTDEEEIFFPAALLGAPSYEMTRLVLELHREHIYLVEQVDAMLETFDEETVSTEFITKADLEVLQDLLADLKAHAAKEMAHIFPLFEDGGKALPALRKILDAREEGSNW